jgi:hypothetical protein
MGAEMNRREAMHEHVEDTAKYLGAIIPGEKRLVLVPLDSQDPWAAFKRMRTWMKESKREASVDLFEAPVSLTHSAKVIPLESRRKTS